MNEQKTLRQDFEDSLRQVVSMEPSDYRAGYALQKAKAEKEEAFYRAMREDELVNATLRAEEAKFVNQREREESIAKRMAYPLSKPMNYSEVARKAFAVEPIPEGALKYYTKPSEEDVEKLKYKTAKMAAKQKMPEPASDEEIIEIARREMERFWKDGNFETEDQIKFYRELDATLDDWLKKGDLNGHQEEFVEALVKLITRWTKKRPTESYHPITKEKIHSSPRAVDPKKYTGQMKVAWTREAAEDMAAWTKSGLDIREVLVQNAIQEMNAEMDARIISSLRDEADYAEKNGYAWPPSTGYLPGTIEMKTSGWHQMTFEEVDAWREMGRPEVMTNRTAEAQDLKAKRLLTKEEVLEHFGQPTTADQQALIKAQAMMQQDQAPFVVPVVETMYELGKKEPIRVTRGQAADMTAQKRRQIDMLRREAVRKNLKKSA